MASRALQAFRRTVTVDWPNIADEDARRHLVRVARAGNAKILADQAARGGVAPDVDAYANTPGNRNLDSVKLPGPIVFRYRYAREIVKEALVALRAASPVTSGLYRDSHTLFINGIPVEFLPQTVLASDEVYIANPVPYARRLEVGLTESGRPFVVQVPPRIYERVLKGTLIPRFRNVANLSLIYVTIPDAYIIKGRLPSHYIAKGGVRRKRRQQVGMPVQSPAILIDLKTS